MEERESGREFGEEWRGWCEVEEGGVHGGVRGELPECVWIIVFYDFEMGTESWVLFIFLRRVIDEKNDHLC